MSEPLPSNSPSKRIKTLHRKHGAGSSLKAFAAQLRTKDKEGLALVTAWVGNIRQRKAGVPIPVKKAVDPVPTGKGSVLKKR